MVVASVQFMRKSYQSAKTAALIAAVALVFLVVCMWDAHHHHVPTWNLKGMF
jgi:hypothetical protein